MSVGAALLAVGVVAVGTYLMRAGLILLLADRAFPDVVERALRNVGPAVLAALAVSLAATGEGSAPDLPLAELLALVASGIVAWRRYSLIYALVAGMATLWVVSAIVG